MSLKYIYFFYVEHDKELCLIYNIIWHEIQCIKNKGSSQLNNITGMFSTNLASTSLQLVKSWSQFLLKYNKQGLCLSADYVHLKFLIFFSKISLESITLLFFLNYETRPFSEKCMDIKKHIPK